MEGTSSVVCTYKKLKDAFGRPAVSDNSGWNKTNFIWYLETDSGTQFSIFNRHERGTVIRGDEVIKWNIKFKDPLKSEEVERFVDSKVLGQNLEESRILQRRAGIKKLDEGAW